MRTDSTHVYYGLTVWRGRLDTVFDDDSSLMVESSIAKSIVCIELFRKGE